MGMYCASVLIPAFLSQKSGGANQRKVNKDEWVKPKPGTYVTRLARNSGALDCRPGKPC